MTWEQRFGALIELDGEEWDAAHKRLEQEWLAAYTAAFVEIAVSRGWRRENAETWRHWRSYGTDPLPTAADALDQPFSAFPSWFLRITCDRCGKDRITVRDARAAERPAAP